MNKISNKHFSKIIGFLNLNKSLKSMLIYLLIFIENKIWNNYDSAIYQLIFTNLVLEIASAVLLMVLELFLFNPLKMESQNMKQNQKAPEKKFKNRYS